jgi:hypothetical protein
MKPNKMHTKCTRLFGQKKGPKSLKLRARLGGDKQDRTADLTKKTIFYSMNSNGYNTLNLDDKNAHNLHTT